LNHEVSKVLAESTEKLSMGFGYDSDIEIYGIFSYSTDKQAPPSKINPQIEFNRYMDGLSVEMVKDLYLLLSANTAAVEYLSGYYKKRKAWKYINFLNRKVIPGNKSFMTFLDQYVKTNPRCSGIVSDKKAFNDSKIKAVLSQKSRLTIVDDYR
jgi:hypothetical protein